MRLFCATHTGDSTPVIAAFGRCLFESLSLPFRADTIGVFGEERLVQLQERRAFGSCDVVLTNAPAAQESARSNVPLLWPLAHAADLPGCNSSACPPRPLKCLQWPGHKLSRRHNSIGLAVAVAVLDSEGSVLLTRRSSHMRIFPSAWVLPGGKVDEGELLAEAGAREVREETGLCINATDMQPLALWESVFPTTSKDCLTHGSISGHHLVAYYQVRLLERHPAVVLSPGEADAAVWVDAEKRQRTLEGGAVETPQPSDVISPHDESAKPMHLRQLSGIYPNAIGEGIAQGSMFALQQLSVEKPLRLIAGYDAWSNQGSGAQSAERRLATL